MEMFDKILLYLHVSAGFMSLVVFLIPLFVKKGGKMHRRVGWVYVYTMWVVVISAGILSIINIFHEQYVIALFLGFLSFITAGPLWSGIAILKYKKNIPDSFTMKKKIYATIMLVFGLVNLVVGFNIKGEGTLLIIFGVLGIVSGVPDVLANSEKIKTRTNWYIEHLSGMITGGIAAYTAFFAFGGRAFLGKIFTGQLMVIPWILPTIIGVSLIRYYKWKTNKTVSR